MAHWEIITELFTKLREEKLMEGIILKSRSQERSLTHFQAVRITLVEQTGDPWGKNQPPCLGQATSCPTHPAVGIKYHDHSFQRNY